MQQADGSAEHLLAQMEDGSINIVKLDGFKT